MFQLFNRKAFTPPPHTAHKIGFLSFFQYRRLDSRTDNGLSDAGMDLPVGKDASKKESPRPPHFAGRPLGIWINCSTGCIHRPGRCRINVSAGRPPAPFRPADGNNISADYADAMPVAFFLKSSANPAEAC